MQCERRRHEAPWPTAHVYPYPRTALNALRMPASEFSWCSKAQACSPAGQEPCWPRLGCAAHRLLLAAGSNSLAQTFV